MIMMRSLVTVIGLAFLANVCLGQESQDYLVMYEHGCEGENDLGSSNGQSARACAALCTANPSCISFEHRLSDGRCQLSSTCGYNDIQINDPEFDYYAKGVAPHSSDEFSAYFTGGCVAQNDVSLTRNAKNCRLACVADAQCVSYEHRVSNNQCYLSYTCNAFSQTVNDPNDNFNWYLRGVDPPPPEQGGVSGDPHIRRWQQDSFDFHGECDLVMVHSDTVNGNKGMDLHIRTTIDGPFSAIESAALRVQDTIVEFDAHAFYYQGQVIDWNRLPLTTPEFTVQRARRLRGTGKRLKRQVYIVLNDQSSIHVIRTFGFGKTNFLSINVSGSRADFGTSIGLLGDYATGAALGRDGRIVHDWNEYGMEWQVAPHEPQLFRELRAPQLPYETCKLPTTLPLDPETLRQTHPELYAKAQVACAHVDVSEFKDCIADVMTADNLAAAEAFE